MKDRPNLVSVHGGHSGRYCRHARDTLEEMIQTYIQEGFKWVGITEHMPPPLDCFRYPDEVEAGITAADLNKSFRAYMDELNRLKKEYSSRILIFTGFEAEAYTGYKEYVKMLIRTFQPDYIVGSVHHVDDLCFDFSETMYWKAAFALGGLDLMYEKYFDIQYRMISELNPAVVGHFDLVRLFDPDYRSRIKKPGIWEKIERNLEACKTYDLILDFNTRALAKDAAEPYITEDILDRAIRMGIKIVPGDDSHGVSDIGEYTGKGIELLEKKGVSTSWPTPELYIYNEDG